jgi:capsular exopolysaccharide synthesis family protein
VADQAGVGLADVLAVLRLRWRIAAAVFVAILVGVVLYAYSLPREYTAKAVVALTPRPNTGTSATDVEQLGQKYVAYVTAPSTVRLVAPTVGVSASTLGNNVSAAVATASVDLTVKVQLRSPHRAAAAANALADSIVTLADDDKLLTALTVAPATVPTEPSKPRRKLIEGAGALVALLAAIGAALLVERGRPRARSSNEIAFATGYPVIARIPPSRAIRTGVEEAVADPVVGGAIRSLRTVLDQLARDEAIRSLVVTSSVPGEGKSTVASSLGWAIARLDARVLVIDADLRHPAVSRMFGLAPTPGLVEVLRGEVSLKAAARAVEGAEGLYVLPTVGVSAPGDLLAKNLNTVLRAATADYDVVIVDTPPLLVGDDAGTIATLTSAVLMVVSDGVEVRRLNEAMRQLDAVQARVIGVVHNRAEVASYGYAYRAADRQSPPAGGPSAVA